jgi:diphthamide synthase (EF-2-diphthine--ammonia ligase)
MNEFISLGFKAVIVCINTAYLDQSFCGRLIDDTFLQDLPSNVDVCGEKGEYHSFVFDGPIFSKPVCFTKGEIIYREYPAPIDTNVKTPNRAGFYFQDLIPCK